MTENIYNVHASVVALIPAHSEQHAIERLWTALEKAGFAVYDDTVSSKAFESEDLGEGIEDIIRHEWEFRS